MNFSVVRYSDIDRDAYGSLLADSSGATVFHALDWMPIYELFSPNASQLLVCARDQGTLLAAMPVTVFRKLCVRAVFSSGFSLYGGPIMRTSCGSTVLRGLLGYFERTLLGPRTVLCSIHDFAGVCGFLRERGFQPGQATTHVMMLPSSVDEFKSSLKRNVRYPINRAAREGVSVARVTAAADFEQWQQLCSDNYLAYGRKPYPRALYRAVARRLRESDALRFCAAKLEGRVVGGVVYFVALGQAFYWMSATDLRFHRFGVNHAIIHATLCDAIRTGVSLVDFGVTPEGSAGVSYFKRKWGLETQTYLHYDRVKTIGRVGANLLRYGRVSPANG
jgi:hypothetical protein